MNGKRFNHTGMAGSAAVLLILLASNAGAALYSGGAGTEGAPYRIGTAADWNTLCTTEEDWDKHFLLITDIDFGDAFLMPVGPNAEVFNGIFDGNGHVLRNGRINLPTRDDVGLFGAVDRNGEIRNLGVENLSVTGRWHVGGIAGFNNGLIEACYTTGSVTGDTDVGGVAGYSQGAINECYATGTVTGTIGVGGLAGTLKGGEVTLCCATGRVECSGNVAGGLVGSSNSESTITLSYATGAVTGGTVVGGLLGGNGTGNTVALCYAALKADATGTVTGTTEVGGLIGRTDVAAIHSYWDRNSSGLTGSAAGESRATEEMTYPHASNTYLSWDFTVVWAADTEYRVNDGYPYLRNCAGPPDEGEEAACGCCQSTDKYLVPAELLERTLGDWLLVGVTLMGVAFCAGKGSRPKRDAWRSKAWMPW